MNQNLIITHERIKQLRNDKGWTQVDLADKLDIETRMVSQYENQKTVPSAETLLKLSDVFNVSVDYLLIENAIRTPLRNDTKSILLDKIEDIEALPEEDKKLFIRFTECLVTNNKLKELANS